MLHLPRYGNGRPTSPTDRGALFGLGVFRTVTAVWAVVVALVDARSGVLVRPSLAFAILGPLLVWSVMTVVLARRSPDVLTTTPAQVIDLAFGAAVVAAEWFTYDGDHPLRFGAMWQLAPIISAGLRFGTLGGLAAGTALGILNAVVLATTEGLEGYVLASLSAIVLFGVAGAASGAILDRLRRVEDDLAEARARERVAQTLHDGVLQTLAVIQRRSDDAELVELAATQDRDLRRWIRQDMHDHEAGTGTTDGAGSVSLVDSLHNVAEDLRRREHLQVNVVAVGSPETPPELGEALLGAIREAVTNASKHGRASSATVFVDQDDDELVCSVNDDGSGFDEDALVEGFGMTTSMRAPIERLGGEVTIGSGPGVGTQVEIRVPLGRRGRQSGPRR